MHFLPNTSGILRMLSTMMVTLSDGNTSEEQSREPVPLNLYSGKKDPHWWMMYKYPQIEGETTGHEYVYIDDNGSSLHDDIANSPLGKISGSEYIYYNDEPPYKPDCNHHSHSKGVLTWNERDDHMTWLLHTLPRYPLPQAHGPPKYTVFDTNIKTFAQTFLHFKIDKKYKDQLIQHLSTQNVHVYDSTVKVPRATQFVVKSQIKTISGMPLILYSKPKSIVMDIYEVLDGEKKVQSWLNGSSSKLGNTKDIRDVEMVSLKKKKWDSDRDHSKWVVNDNKVFCHCSLNRVGSQLRRGGEMICMEKKVLFREGILVPEP